MGTKIKANAQNTMSDLFDPDPAVPALQIRPSPVNLPAVMHGFAPAPPVLNRPPTITLSALLGAISSVVDELPPVWVTLEVVNARFQSSGHIYLEVSESKHGTVAAKCSAMIWKTKAGIVKKFEQATGARLTGGVKLLVHARPVFKAQYGFSLEIEAIDTQYTLGDLEAKKREIRERLIREGLFDTNKRLAAPIDFYRILVVAPPDAAGLGDFKAEADRLQLHGICIFRYITSRFQGEGAAIEIRSALVRAMDTWREAPDAAVIIRGGGAVNDLAWLNDYALARTVCEYPVPVFTGIGHERDSCVLDEVAHTKFDTPSKVIAAIESVIRKRAQDVRDNFAIVETAAKRALAIARQNITEADHTVRTGAKHRIALARQASTALLAEVSQGAAQTVREARKDLPALVNEIATGVRASTRTARTAIEAPMVEIRANARKSTAEAADRARGLFLEITGQGPERTMARGFAVVRNTEGVVLSTASEAAGTVLDIQFKDGTLRAHAQKEQP